MKFAKYGSYRQERKDVVIVSMIGFAALTFFAIAANNPLAFFRIAACVIGCYCVFVLLPFKSANGCYPWEKEVDN